MRQERERGRDTKEKADMEVSSSSVTTMASIPEITPKVIDPWRPKLTSSRKFVVQDDPNTSDFTDPLSGTPKGKASPGHSSLTEWKPDSCLISPSSIWT